MALLQRALRRLAHGREGGHQDVVERGAVGDLLLELVGAGPQLLVREARDLVLERIDGVDARLITTYAPLMRGAGQLTGDGTKHVGSSACPAQKVAPAASRGRRSSRRIRSAALFGLR